MQLPEREGIRRLRTVTIPDRGTTRGALTALKRDLARRSGVSRSIMARAVSQREPQESQGEIEYYETLQQVQGKRSPLGNTARWP